MEELASEQGFGAIQMGFAQTTVVHLIFTGVVSMVSRSRLVISNGIQGFSNKTDNACNTYTVNLKIVLHITQNCEQTYVKLVPRCHQGVRLSMVAL